MKHEDEMNEPCSRAVALLPRTTRQQFFSAYGELVRLCHNPIVFIRVMVCVFIILPSIILQTAAISKMIEAEMMKSRSPP